VKCTILGTISAALIRKPRKYPIPQKAGEKKKEEEKWNEEAEET
jgi:hypothetical protein